MEVVGVYGLRKIFKMTYGKGIGRKSKSYKIKYLILPILTYRDQVS